MKRKALVMGSVVHLILGVAVLAFAIAVTLIITGFGGMFVSAQACYTMSSWRHGWKSFGMGPTVIGAQAVYVSDYIPVQLPLLGCQTRRIDLGTAYPETIAETIGEHAVTCFGQFGRGDWNVLWELGENPWKCSEISFVLPPGESMTALNLTYYLNQSVYDKGKDCRICENPCVDAGFNCYEKNPEFCAKEEENPYTCRSALILEEMYIMCTDGVPTTVNSYWDCVDYLSEFVCLEYGLLYYYDGDPVDDGIAGICRSGADPDDSDLFKPPILPDVAMIDYTAPANFGDEVPGFQCMFCNGTYPSVPQHCTLKGDVKQENCTKDVTYYDFLKPGSKTIYSFKSRGESGYIVDPFYPNVSVSGQVSVFVEYIDSFTYSRKAVDLGNLPIECALGTFLDSCSGCLQSCTTGTLTTFGIVGMVKKHPVVSAPLLVSDQTSGLYYLGIGDKVAGFITGVPLLSIGASIYSCAECLDQAAQGGSADIMACEDMLLICLYEHNV